MFNVENIPALTNPANVAADRLAACLARAAARNEEVPQTRIDATLPRAIELGADDATLDRLVDAIRVNHGPTITLPRHRFEGCSRGRGWARKGRGNSAEWGERTDDGYLVGPGRWTVGGNDGFSRKGEDKWDVEHITVGSETWTVAS